MVQILRDRVSHPGQGLYVQAVLAQGEREPQGLKRSGPERALMLSVA